MVQRENNPLGFLLRSPIGVPTFDKWGCQFEGPFEQIDDLRMEQGIYTIWYKGLLGGIHILLDVGESEDVYSRVRSHDRETDWKQESHGWPLLYSVCYTPGYSKDQRRALEQRLRLEGSPPCGDR